MCNKVILAMYKPISTNLICNVTDKCNMHWYAHVMNYKLRLSEDTGVILFEATTI